MSKKKKRVSISTIILVFLLLVGLAVMLYPTISDWWNSNIATHAIANYDQRVADLDDDTTAQILQAARDYNSKLSKVYAPFSSPDEVPGYYNTLDITGTGIMGYVTVQVIGVELPIYHGTSEGVLNIAVGHMQGSSLPIGGTSTHAVLSAHRGLPSARLFTDIDELVVGDIFTITVLKEIYTYEVEEILIVLPHEVDKLAIQPGRDMVTLMTCTPYGINTHRLLVRAHRIDTEYARTVLVSADCVQVDPMLVVPVIAAPLVIGLIFFWIWSSKKKEFSLPMDDPLSVLPGRMPPPG